MLRYGKEPFLECSSRGDKRFSAFFAVVNGETIEKTFQGAKVFEDGSTGLSIKDAKGRKAVNQEDVSKLYRELWTQYFDENPELLSVLKRYNGFSDMFGQEGHVCQSTEVWRIYNQRVVNNAG